METGGVWANIVPRSMVGLAGALVLRKNCAKVPLVCMVGAYFAPAQKEWRAPQPKEGLVPTFARHRRKVRRRHPRWCLLSRINEGEG